MLDILESFGFDLDGVGRNISVRIHGVFFKNDKPQSMCAFLVHRGYRNVVKFIGTKHCLRSYDRYY